MIDYESIFKEMNIDRLVKASNIDPKIIYDILVDNYLYVPELDEETKENYTISSSADFERNAKLGYLICDSIHTYQYAYFHNFLLEEKHRFILDNYYKYFRILPPSKINEENRKFVFDYLVSTGQTNKITFGLDQEWDMKNILDVEDAIEGLDFANWSTDFTYHFDGEHREILLKQFANMFSDAQIDWSENFIKIIKDVLINHNGFDVIQYCNEEMKEQLFYCVLSDDDNRDSDVLLALRDYKNIDFETMQIIIDLLGDGTVYTCPSQYINVDAFINFVVELNKKSGDQPDVIYNTHAIYRINSNNEHSERFNKEYVENKDFTYFPILFNFKYFIARYENLGIYDFTHLFRSEINPTNYYEFFNFILNLESKDIDLMMEIDYSYELATTFKHLKHNLSAELIAKHPKLILYYM